LPATRNKPKDSFLRTGIDSHQIDIMGIAEVNIDWQTITYENKAQTRVKEWWEACHTSLAYNCTETPLQSQQWGGTAILSRNKVAHRVIEARRDPNSLGRWS